jgi:AraC-like DNA-binding protein
LHIDGSEPATLESGNFVLIPAAFNFSMSGHDQPRHEVETLSTVLADGEIRHGDPERRADVHMVVGYCIFDTPDVALLTSLLPESILVRSEPRLAALIELVRDESRHQRPARDVIVAHLLEVLLIEALRSSTEINARPGLLRGLADDRLGAAIRRIHENPAEPWTITRLAREAALSRSVFFERFRRKIGTSPMDYLLAWRMSLAKDLLRDGTATVTEIAAIVGYSSPSTFSVAFTRHVGLPPSRYARQLESYAS